MINFLNKLKELTSVKNGRLIRVANKQRNGNEKHVYTAVWVEDANGSNERCILLTDNELERAEYRASRNPEDLTEKNFVTDLLD
jgi:hypothetical protein